MELFVRGFIRSSLVWLGVGVALGVWMVFDPARIGYRPAHLHANLLGFVSMMIFGVAYHVIPRFAGAPLSSRRAPLVHLAAANVGLALMVAGFMARLANAETGAVLLRAGAISNAIGVALFVATIWRTLDQSMQKGSATRMPQTLPIH
jgi:cytochrome c oxidase cbb3-type subunit 1